MDDRIREATEGVAELVMRVKDHPEVRLALLAEAADAIGPGSAGVEAAGRARLAERLERWRYQLVNHRSGRLNADETELSRRIDGLMVAVSGRAPRPPRSVRSALLEAPGSGPCLDMLDPSVPTEEVERQARDATQRRFSAGPDGRSQRTMVLYAPLYVSNHCINHCLYCGFRYPEPMPRQQLDPAAAVAEADELRRRGFRHVLVVAGEYPGLITLDYLASIVGALAEQGLDIGIEVAPQGTLGYETLRQAGVASVTLYQETYDEPTYAINHPKGTKAWFDWRLEGPERAAEAGIGRVGLGVLLGLADPRAELRALIAHGRYLLARFPDLSLSFGLPRIREAPAGFATPSPVDDDTFIRFACALRLAFPAAHLVLSTREPPALRDRLAEVCITQMSAGSSTAPGGYTDQHADCGDRQQFPVFDHRSPAEVAAYLAGHGFEVRWTFDPSTHRA